MRLLRCSTLSLGVVLVMAATMYGQGMPTSQPGVLTITVEELKPGLDGEHEKNESGWPLAFAKANSQYYYLAIEAITGTPQVWYLSPYASFAAQGENMKQNRANAALSAELDRLWREDGKYLESSHNIQTVARPDLSYGAFPDLGLVRFYDITTIRIRPGHEDGFENAAKLYMQQVKKAAPARSYRLYTVTAGMPGPTYLIFEAVNSYADFDKMMAESRAMWEKVSPQDMATLQQTMSNDVQSVITNRFRVSPTMSYVSAETKAKDKTFWK